MANSKPDQTTDGSTNKTFDRTFTAVATVAVAAALVAGFWVLGTPGRQRLIAADRQRLGDLNAIAQQLHQAYLADQDGYTLPDTLADTDTPNDPLTNQTYLYKRLGDQAYQLCADFSTDSSTYPFRDRPQPPEVERWQHPQGQHCFDLDVSEPPPGYFY